MPEPFFSVIIPTYNRAGFIEKTIRSILNQTYENFEVIVVDDGSTDNTAEVVKGIKDNRIKYYKKENAERGAARNYGAKMAKGTYLNFFDSDDYAYPNHLQTAFALVKEQNFPQVFALNYDIQDENGKLLRKSPCFTNINKQLIRGNILSCNGVFLSRVVAMKHPFSEIRALSGSEDYLLWLEISTLYTFSFSNTPTSTIIEHHSRSVLSMDTDTLILRKKVFVEELFSKLETKIYFAPYKNAIMSQIYSYIALHIALQRKNIKTCMNYFFMAIRYDSQLIYSKRFFAIGKHLILSIFN